MRTRTFVAGMLACLGTLALAQALPSTPVSKAFPHVLATVSLQPGQSASITVPDAHFTGAAPGEMTVYIPPDAFKDPVTFQLLASSNARWDSQVKSGLQVVANFAYRVIDTKTNQPVQGFSAPVHYTVADSMIDKHSIYWAVKPGATPSLINANAGSTIQGDVLSHATPTAAVGWIITTPKADLAMTGNGASKPMTTNTGNATPANGGAKNGM